jgi:hypothetical protein
MTAGSLTHGSPPLAKTASSSSEQLVDASASVRFAGAITVFDPEPQFELLYVQNPLEFKRLSHPFLGLQNV